MSKCPMCGGAATVSIRLPDGVVIPAANVTEAQRLLRSHQRQWPDNDLSISVVAHDSEALTQEQFDQVVRSLENPTPLPPEARARMHESVTKLRLLLGWHADGCPTYPADTTNKVTLQGKENG